MPITRAFRDRLHLAATLNPLLSAIGLAPQVLPSGPTVGTSRDINAWPTLVSVTTTVGAVTGTNPTLTVLVEESTTGVGAWTTAYTSAALAAANTITSATFERTKRYIRATGTVGGTVTPTVAGSVLFRSAASGVLGAGALWLGLYESVVNNGLDTVLADFTMPATSVAVRQAVATWSAAYDLTDGRRVADAPRLTFRPSSSADASTVGGWFLVDAAAAGNVLQWEPFGQALPMPDENSAVSVILRPTLDPDARWSAAVSFNG